MDSRERDPVLHDQCGYFTPKPQRGSITFCLRFPEFLEKTRETKSKTILLSYIGLYEALTLTGKFRASLRNSAKPIPLICVINMVLVGISRSSRVSIGPTASRRVISERN
jgi:hypothetical protein